MTITPFEVKVFARKNFNLENHSLKLFIAVRSLGEDVRLFNTTFLKRLLPHLNSNPKNSK